MGQRRKDRLLYAAEGFVLSDAYKQLFSVVACRPCKLHIDRLGFAWHDGSLCISFPKKHQMQNPPQNTPLYLSKEQNQMHLHGFHQQNCISTISEMQRMSRLTFPFFKKAVFVTSFSVCWAEDDVSASPIWEFNAFWWRLCCRPSQAEPVFVIKQNEITASKWKAWLIFSADTVCSYAKACLTSSQQIQ